MSVIVLLIVAGGIVAGGFLAAFAWAVGAGQFDDTVSPPIRMLFDDSSQSQETDSSTRSASHDIRR